MKKRVLAAVTLLFCLLICASASVFADAVFKNVASKYPLTFISLNDRTYTVSLTYPGLKSEYTINNPETEMNKLEYSWGFRFTDGKKEYEVATKYFHSETEVKTRQTSLMQTNLWVKSDDGQSFKAMTKFSPIIKDDTITWEFTVPEDFDQSNFTVQRVEVRVLNYHYRSDQGEIDTGTAAKDSAADNKDAAKTADRKSVKITASNKTFKAKTKTKKYTVTLKSGTTPVKGVKLTLKVNKKTYTAKTNAKGKAVFKINKLNRKGRFTATIKFAGNKNYKAAGKKVKITVKK